MPKMRTLQTFAIVVLIAGIGLLAARPAFAANDDPGYMDRMLMSLSGQTPPEQIEATPPQTQIEPPLTRKSNGLLPEPEIEDADNLAPVTPLKLASGSASPPPDFAGLSPASGDTPVTQPKEAITSTAQPATPAQSPAIETEPAYRLNVGDLLRVTVYGVTDLTNTYKIDSAGKLTIPLVGEIPARGRAKEEVQTEIAQRLIEGGYYNSPSVTVEVMELAPFYILGEVKNPGRYPFEPALDIFKAVAVAGGYTPRAAKDKIVIIRDVNGKKTEIDASEDTRLLPGDSIKVKQRFF